MMFMEQRIQSVLDINYKNNALKRASFILALFICININAELLLDKKVYIVKPVSETGQVISKGDAADDPAIWVNPYNSSNSLVFGTDKRSGIYTFDLFGNEISYTKIGKINNIDLRSIDFESKGSFSFIFASNRSKHSLDLWIYESKAIDLLINNKSFYIPKNSNFSINSKMIVYGVCAGYDIKYGVVAFLTEDEGPHVEMYQYFDDGLRLLKRFKNQNSEQSEGCVYDDENRTLFISEEGERGIIRAYDINDDLDFSNFNIVDTREGFIDEDPEGLTIYKTDTNKGYLIASSQGDNSFNLYNRQNPYNYIGSFKIGHSLGIDNVSDTDGIDVTNINLGTNYKKGLFVVQDGTNDGAEIVERQNFKYVSFEDVIKVLNL